jgi:hypothetical protein
MKSILVLIAAASVPLASCSFSIGTSPDQAGEELIEGELGEQIGLSFVDAECTEPVDEEVGTPFTCTAATDDGQTVTFAGVIDPDDSIFVAASNVITGDEMSRVEAEAVRATALEFDADPATLTVDCPDETTVLDDSRITCVLTDITEGPPYELFVSFGEFELREGFDGLSYELGAPIE